MLPAHMISTNESGIEIRLEKMRMNRRQAIKIAALSSIAVAAMPKVAAHPPYPNGFFGNPQTRVPYTHQNGVSGQAIEMLHAWAEQAKQ
jgi:hypothetical protein